jgi:hypothetical protein
MLHTLPTPPSYRRRALAHLDRLIAQAERDVARHHATGTRKAVTRDGARRERGRLELLRRSRRFLLSGEFPPEMAAADVAPASG